MIRQFGDGCLPARFWSKVSPEPMSGCWLWTGCATSRGYGSFKSGGVMVAAHRLAWSRLVGLIPGGLVIDHRCRIRCCVNPAHLEPVTMAVNTARGTNGRAVASANRARLAQRVACQRGHLLDSLNTIGRSSDSRKCRACTNARKAEYRRRQSVHAGDK